MPWCPKCKNEYVDGMTECADCGCRLVASLEADREPLLFGGQEQMTRLISFLSYNGITSANMQEDETENVYELFVAREELDQAKQITAVFLREEALREAKAERAENDGDDVTETELTDMAADALESSEEAFSPETKASAGEQGFTGAYKESAQKAAEFKDSAYTLLGVGAIGLIAIALLASGVLPFQIGGSVGWLTYGVMGGLFLIFIIVGARSLHSAKRYKKEAVTESNLKDEIMSWCRESLQAQEIDAQISEEGLSEEEKYFKRTEQIKKQISEKFLNIEEGFLDHLVDEFYPELFE